MGITYATKQQYKSRHHTVKHHLQYETLPFFSTSQNAIEELNNVKEGTVTNCTKKNVFHVEQTWKELKGLSKKKTLGDLCEKYTHQT